MYSIIIEICNWYFVWHDATISISLFVSEKINILKNLLKETTNSGHRKGWNPANEIHLNEVYAHAYSKIQAFLF